jgi:phenylalanyl-tRNA synthetase alpha chain
MQERLRSLKDRFDTDLAGASQADALGRIRADYLSRKGGELSLLLRSLKDVEPSQRPQIGSSLNELKQYMEERLSQAEA